MAKDGWGASWSFGPTTSRIIHAKTTLVPGRLPPITSSTGPLFLWPGLSNPMSDLVQTTIDAWQDNKGYCGAAAGQWCVEASVERFVGAAVVQRGHRCDVLRVAVPGPDQ